MKGKQNIIKQSKQKIGTNISNIHHSNTHINNNDKNISLPIWEKIYLENKNNIDDEYIDDEYISDFFKESKSIHIKNYLYVFPLYKSEYKYAIIDLSKNILYFHEMPYQCFHPMYSKKFFFSIFLFYLDSNYKSDDRYNIVEFDIKNNIFNILNSKGVSPKERKSFSSFFYSNKIYFFGGIPKMLIDNSLNYIYSFNIKENEWKIEETNYTKDKEKDNANITSNYISKYFDSSIVQVEDKNIFYSIGGKFFDGSIYPEINNIYQEASRKVKESNNIIKITIKENGIIELSDINIKNNNSKINFSKTCSLFYKDNIYIYNKDEMFLYEYTNKEISELQKRMFSPQFEGNSNIFIHERYLYLYGKFKFYDDCYLFRTSIDKIYIKYNETQQSNFDYFINNVNKSKDNNDILCEFNNNLNNSEDKKLYINKIILSNLSINLKHIINNNKTQNKLNFSNINSQTFLIIIKWIYNNFNGEILSNISNDTYKNIFNFFFKYKSLSLTNILISNLIFNENNAIFLYEFGLKYNLKNLYSKAHKYISECLNIKNNDKIMGFNETKEFKKKLYENFFCEHKIYMECSINNIDIHNNSNAMINNEQLNNVKKLNKNGKLFYCLICYKVFLPNENNE